MPAQSVQTFPSALNALVDSSGFTPMYEDVVKRTEMEGGYLITRPRHTRPARRLFKFQLTFTTDSQKTALETFFRTTTKGGVLPFTFIIPITSEVATFYFKNPPTFKYVGVKTNYHWDVSLEIEEL